MIAASNIQSALEHITRAYRSSETRTPLIVSGQDGNPAPSIDFLARQQNSRVWSITMEGDKGSEQNALDYVEVGVHNGDWVLLQCAERCSFDTMRKIGTLLLTLKPEPKVAPRREFFRLWLQVSPSVDININEHVKPLFPQIITQNSLLCRVREQSAAASPEKAQRAPTPQAAAAPSGSTKAVRPSAAASAAAAGSSSPSPTSAASASGGASPTKLMHRVHAEPALLKSELEKHTVRREQGRDSDSDSDAEEAEKKATGLWFHRNVEFFSNDKEASVEDYKKTIFDKVDAEDVDAIKEIANSGHIDIDKVKRDGMTPLMYAVSRQREKSVRTLIADVGADVTLRREADGSPLLFMAIENPAILEHLIAGGVDMKTKFEGYVLEDHPLTAPHIVALVKQMRRAGKFI